MMSMPAFPLSGTPLTHDDDHDDMLREVTTLHPQAQAVMFVVEPDPEAEDPEALRYVLHSYGLDGEWHKILGVLAAGSAYVTTSMFSTPPGVEETSGGPQAIPADQAPQFAADEDDDEGDENAPPDETGA